MNCEWCEAEIGGDPAALWFDTPLGLTCRHTCRTQECAKALVAAMTERGWRFRRDGPPMGAAERAAKRPGPG